MRRKKLRLKVKRTTLPYPSIEERAAAATWTVGTVRLVEWISSDCFDAMLWAGRYANANWEARR